MDVDYQANRNVLDEALIDNVKTFMYISVFNSDKLRHLEIVKAKERFAQDLKKADIEHIIIRPNGFFSDLTEFFMTVLAMDMVAPTYGQHTIKQYFKEISEVCDA